MSRTEAHVTQAFVSLTRSLVSGDDVIDLLTYLTAECARLLAVASAGLLLADSRGLLHVMAASSERTRELELFQIQRDEGPCRDSYSEGKAISVPDLSRMKERWPQFAPAAEEAGFASVHALPMRLRDTKLGTLGLFGAEVGSLSDDDLSLGQALADVASVALIQDRAATDRSVINDQLQSALTSRVVIEQAKGILAQQGGLEMEQAFKTLRRYARDNNLRLTDVARSIVTRELPSRQLLNRAPSRPTGRP